MNKTLNKLLAGMSAVWLAFAVPAEAKLFDMQEFYLDNGLQVIVIPNYKAPIIKQMVWYKAGSVDEAAGKGGTAHLLEHLMFRGTDKIKGAEFNAVIQENGGVSNAFTAQDYTAYHELSDISRLELMMYMEADRMQNLKITPEDFARERDIVYQERMQVVENSPTAYFGESFRRNLWQEHPYSRPVTGMPEEIMSLTIDDVNDFYQKYYAPNNAILVLSGDINYAAARELAQKYYGGIPSRKVGSKAQFPKLNKYSETTMKMELPQINIRRFIRSYIVPSYNQDKNASYALTVLSRYLGEGDTSELYRKLVVEDGIAIAAETSYDGTARGSGSFTISALPKSGVSNEEFEKKLNNAIQEALEELNAEELQKVKRKMLAGIIYLKDNPGDAAMIVGSMAASGMSVEDIEEYDADINAVTLGEVKKAADGLKKSINVQGILAPAQGA